MAIFSMRISQVKRSEGRSAVAAAAYRAGQCLHDERTGKNHDYRYKTDIEHTEIMLPVGAPNWVQGYSREELWNHVEAFEKRKDSQTARDLRITIPRELNRDDRIALVRNFVANAYVSKGMIADIAFHCPNGSDGKPQPHAHVLLSMRPLTDTGWGKKSRHDWIEDPDGRTHPDGRPLMVESNADSWNSAAYYESTRKLWEDSANSALERIGSAERIDRRSLLERGLARMPEPALRLAHHLKELYGVMRERFGQFQVARHYRAVEQRAKAAFDKMGTAPTGTANVAHTQDRFFGWFDRQLERLGVPSPVSSHEQGHDQGEHGLSSPRSPPSPDLER